MLPTFMEVLDTSIAAVALPHIGGSLAATPEEATWVLTSYLVANAVVLPASGWFSLRFGRRNFLLFCIGAIYRRVVSVRNRGQLELDSDRQSSARRGRRRSATFVASHTAGEFSEGKKGARPWRYSGRSGGRSRARAHS